MERHYSWLLEILPNLNIKLLPLQILFRSELLYSVKREGVTWRLHSVFLPLKLKQADIYYTEFVVEREILC